MKKCETKLVISFDKIGDAPLDKIFHLPLEDELIIINDVTFQWNSEINSFCILEGKNDILGIVIPIKSYTIPEFNELISSLKIGIVIVSANKNIDIDSVVTDEYKDNVEIIKNFNYDYPATITFLEKKGVIIVKDSVSQMATDNRCFMIQGYNPGCDYDRCENSNYNTYYEVDILGTPYGEDVASEIIKLYLENS
jgi:hypothetical protein